MSEREYERMNKFLLGLHDSFGKARNDCLSKNFARLRFSKQIAGFDCIIDTLKMVISQYEYIHNNDPTEIIINNRNESLEKALEWVENNPPEDNFDELIKEMECKINE